MDKDNRMETNDRFLKDDKKTRWRDEVVKFAGMTWMRPAQDRSKWCQLVEAFALQWADNGRDDGSYIRQYDY